MDSKTKIRLAVIPAAIVTAALTIAVTVLGVKLTNKKQTHSTFPAPLINKIPGFPFIINPDDHQPQPAYKAAKEPWHQRLIIDDIDVPQIKRTIHKLWGLDINDFEWCVEEHRFEHYGLVLDTAYQLWFDDWCTIFYDRIHPQSPYKTTEGGWHELGTLEGVNPVNINAFVKQVWGLTINDFKWIEDKWWEHDGFHHDIAYKLTLYTWQPFTTFYERFR